MSLQDFELAAEYCALDTDAAGDGEFVNVHALRSLAKSANYLVRGKGHELMTLMFDARVAGNAGVPVFPALVDCVAGLSWGRMLPGRWMRPKQPGLNTMDVLLQARITPNASVLVQVETLHGVLDLNATGPSARVFGLAGPASYSGANDTTTYALRNIPIDEGPYERLGFWVRGQPTGTLGDTSTRANAGAGSNVNTVVSVTTNGPTATLVGASGSQWNTDDNAPRFQTQVVSGGAALGLIMRSVAGTERSWASDNFAYVHNGPDLLSIGYPIYQAQIVGVPDDHSLILYPPPLQHVSDLAGKRMAIYQLPTVQIVSIACFANWRTS